MTRKVESEVNNMKHYNDIAIDLHTRRYPDVTGTALLHLRRVEQLRQHRGYEGARHWGTGSQHEELRRLGLATFGEPSSNGCTPVDMTDLGRTVAALLDDLRKGIVQPLRCRCCGALSDGVADLCVACETIKMPEPGSVPS